MMAEIISLNANLMVETAVQVWTNSAMNVLDSSANAILLDTKNVEGLEPVISVWMGFAMVRIITNFVILTMAIAV